MATIVRMRMKIGGLRNLKPWPETGGEIELPDGEAADLVRFGRAEYIDEGDTPDEDPTEQQDDAADDEQLDDLTVPELVELAEDEGAEIPAGARKADIIAAIAATRD